MLDVANLRVLATVAVQRAPDISDICVVEHGGQFRMWLSNDAGAELLSLSSDSATDWNWEDVRPALAAAQSLPSSTVAHPFVLHHQRLWYLWYTGGTDGGATIYASTSSHGDRWLGHMPALDPRDWGAAALADPAVVRDHDRHVWLMTHSVFENDRWRVGLSESHDLREWTAVGILMETWLPQVRDCRKARLLRGGDRWHLAFIADHENRRHAFISSSDDLVWWSTPLPVLEGAALPSPEQERCLHVVSRGTEVLLYLIAEDRDSCSLVVLTMPHSSHSVHEAGRPLF